MIYVNGEEKNGYEGLTLEAFIQKENFEKARIAAEINGQIVSKQAYEKTVLKPGDTVQIVSFAGGG